MYNIMCVLYSPPALSPSQANYDKTKGCDIFHGNGGMHNILSVIIQAKSSVPQVELLHVVCAYVME